LISFEYFPRLNMTVEDERVGLLDSHEEGGGGEYGAADVKVFVYSHGLTSKEADDLLEQYGKNELPDNDVPKWLVFLSLFIQPMPIMIWLAVIVELAIQNYLDMSILLVIQFANASIAFYEINKAGDAVAALKASLKPEAQVMRDGVWVTIDATLLVPGDLVTLALGAAVPADCRINEGQVDIDQAQLTGESLPVTMFKGDKPKMGSTVVRGEVEATVEFTGADTFFGKTATLLGGTNEVSNLQNVLITIMIVLVVLSLTLSFIVFVYLLERTDIDEALGFTVILIIASIPLAIEIVTTTTLAVGSKEMSKHGAIVTRLSAIEDLAGMSILCSDKTGTLTLNKMEIQEETPIYVSGETQYSILRYAAMAAKWKEPPKDALDTLVLGSVDMASLDTVKQVSYMPFDPVVKRTEGTIEDSTTGKTYKVTKGAPHIITHLVGDVAVTSTVEKDVSDFGARGIRCIAVAKSDVDDTWKLLGLLTFLDPPRPDTKDTIAAARNYGIAVKMITGDHLLIAKETARRLNMGETILSAEGLPMLDLKTKEKPANLSKDYGDLIIHADGFAQVFPEHKYLIVECLKEMGYKTGMTGDGVNDAPALKHADVGIAVSGSTDAARAAADIVLTEPGLSTIIEGILIARCIFVRIRNFITYRIAATLQLLLFFFIAVFSFKPSEYEPIPLPPGFPDATYRWPDYFHMPVLMLMLITLLNDGTLIAIGYDNVVPSKYPQEWDLDILFMAGSVLALVACASSLLLLYMLLHSWQPGSFFQVTKLGGLSFGQITTSIYLKVSISDFLTLFSARTGGDWFWTTRPAPILFAAGCFALTMSTILACVWPAAYPDGVYTEGLALRPPYVLPLVIWVYCLVWWFVQDAAKVGMYSLLTMYGLYDMNRSSKSFIAKQSE
jgi:H+-transporting ATPase